MGLTTTKAGLQGYDAVLGFFAVEGLYNAGGDVPEAVGHISLGEEEVGIGIDIRAGAQCNFAQIGCKDGFIQLRIPDVIVRDGIVKPGRQYFITT